MDSVRHRNMVQHACLSCDKHTMQSTSDGKAKCLYCGDEVDHYMTKRDIAAHYAVGGEKAHKVNVARKQLELLIEEGLIKR